MNNKKGFNLFGKKDNVLPNQLNDMQALSSEVNETPIVPQQEMQDTIQSISVSETQNQNYATEYNAFSTESMPKPQQNSTDLQPSENSFPTQPLQEQETTNKTIIPTNEHSSDFSVSDNNSNFEENFQVEFSTQETEQSIENKLASPTDNNVVPQEIKNETTQTTAEAEEQTPIAPPPEPGTIDTLNNLGGYEVNIKEAAQKELGKKPFLIVAGVAILFLCAAFIINGGTSKSFGKAPNEIKIPGDNGEDISNKAEIIEEEDNSPNKGTSENEKEHISIENNSNNQDVNNNESNNNIEVEQSTSTSNNKKRLSSGTIINTIENQERTLIKKEYQFNTLYTMSGQLISLAKQDIVYDVIQTDKIVNILENGNTILSLNTLPNPADELEGYMSNALGHILDYYYLITINYNPIIGEFYIYDRNFNAIETGRFHKESAPIVTIDGIYYGKVNCHGTRSDNSTGPIIEVYKFNTKKGESTYSYSIDSNDRNNRCS